MAEILRGVINCLWILAVFTFVIIFSIWSHKALLKLLSNPIASKVTFSYGDDDHGNFHFPAVTICMAKFSYLASKMKQPNSKLMDHCNAFEVLNFDELGKKCTPEFKGSETTTESLDNFGWLFHDDDKPKIDLFTNTSEMIQAATLSVDDVIRSFSFGSLVVLSKSHDKVMASSLRREFWRESIDYKYGSCFTFDPTFFNPVKIIVDYEKLINKELMFLDVEVNFQKLLETSDNPHYKVYLHNSIDDKLNIHSKQADFTLGKANKKILQFMKTNIVSLRKGTCSDDPTYSLDRCQIRNAMKQFIDDYHCRLPWMSYVDIATEMELCPILGHPNGTYNILTSFWLHTLHYEVRKKSCLIQPPCNRTLFTKSVDDWFTFDNPSTNGASFRIQLGSQEIQVIEDYVAYDFQSFVGEVGGTLGLLLGLSFISIFDFLRYLATFIEKESQRRNEVLFKNIQDICYKYLI